MSTDAKDGDDSVVDLDKLSSDVKARAPRIMQHMNADHADSVKAYARAFGVFEDPQKRSEVKSAKITDVTVDGFVVEVELKNGSKIGNVEVPYTTRISSAKDLHKIAIEMHLKAYDKLGVGYKLVHGYYVQAARKISGKIYKKYPKTSIGLVTLTAGAMLFLSGVAFQSRFSTSSKEAVATGGKPRRR